MRDTESAQRARRIAVVGTTGSGKTTLARQVAQRLGIPHVEQDALHWDPNWTPVPTDVFRDRMAQALQGEGWVTDGNYRQVRDTVWSRANTVVWLDYGLPLILWRVARRTLRRCVTREELWNGNREEVQQAFFSRESLFLWVLRTYRRRRKEYPELFAQPGYTQLAVVHLRSQRATREWLESLTP
jgi:adenylate kinase family enzyme